MLVVSVFRHRLFQQMSDCNIRLIDILENEQAVIRVRTKFHIELVFDTCVIDIFEKDNIIYTRQEHHKPDFDVRSEGESEYDGNAETQAMEGYTQIDDYEETLVDDYEFTQVEESPDVIEWCGGTYDSINEHYENELQEGDTQIDHYEETQTEDCYVNGIYIPSYLRVNKYLPNVH